MKLVIIVTIIIITIVTIKWHSESADTAKALGPSDILDRNPVVNISDRCSFSCLFVHTDLRTTFSLVILWQCKAVAQTGDSGDEDSRLNPR